MGTGITHPVEGNVRGQGKDSPGEACPHQLDRDAGLQAKVDGTVMEDAVRMQAAAEEERKDLHGSPSNGRRGCRREDIRERTANYMLGVRSARDYVNSPPVLAVTPRVVPAMASMVEQTLD